MTGQPSEMQAILDRLEKVEKQNRRLKRVGFAVLVLVTAVLAMSQARPNRVVEAEQFILKDANGKTRGELAIDSAGTSTLTLRDAKGWPVVTLRAGEQPFLNLARPDTTDQGMLSMNKDTYGLVLYGDKVRAGLLQPLAVLRACLKALRAVSRYTFFKTSSGRPKPCIGQW